MKLALLFLPTALAGPRKPTTPVDPSQVEQASAAVDIVESSPTQDALVQALSVREPAITCTALAALTPTPAADLTWVVSHVTAPPWAGMKAAECLVQEYAQAARPTLEAWVTDTRLKGLGWVVLKNLDNMPRPIALDLARMAVEKGPDPEGARRRIRRSVVPEIKALGTE